MKTLFILCCSKSVKPTDVMFTDEVEVRYHHQINPQLCLANIPEKFPARNKVFLFAKTDKGQYLNQLFN